MRIRNLPQPNIMQDPRLFVQHRWPTVDVPAESLSVKVKSATGMLDVPLHSFHSEIYNSYFQCKYGNEQSFSIHRDIIDEHFDGVLNYIFSFTSDHDFDDHFASLLKYISTIGSSEKFEDRLAKVFGYIFSIRKSRLSRFKSSLRTAFDQAIVPALRTMKAYTQENANALQVFEQAVKVALRHVIYTSHGEDKPHLGVIKHYIFMINQLANAGGDLLTAAAAMIHNLEDKRAKQVTDDLITTSRKEMAKEVLRIRKLFLRLDSVVYRPFNTGEPRFLMQNFMDALICLAEGDGRPLLMHLVHKLSDLDFENRIDAQKARKFHEIYAPLAERLGMHGLSTQLHSMAFLLEDPISYSTISNDIEEILELYGFCSVNAAYSYLQELESVARKLPGVSRVRSRIKNIWSIYCKIRNGNGYQEAFDLKDLFAVEVVTKDPIQKKDQLKHAVGMALKIAKGKIIDIGFEDMQTETRELKTLDGQTKKTFHIDLICNSPNGEDLHVEVQIMDESASRLLNFEERAHWKYKASRYYELMNPKKRVQLFDLCDIAEYGKKLTGDFLHDARVIYEQLRKKWVYVFYENTSRDKEPGVLRVLRLPKDGLPFDALSLLSRHIKDYSGIRTKKIWQNEFHKTSEVRLFENGDILEMLEESKGKRLSAQRARAILPRLKTLRAKSLLYWNFINTTWDHKASADKGLKLLKLVAKKQKISFKKGEFRRLAIKVARQHEIVPQKENPYFLFALAGVDNPVLITPEEIMQQMLVLRDRV